MRVSKWGNSLAVRIPAEIVEEMGLKEGDEVEFRCRQPDIVEMRVPMPLAARLEWLRANGQLFPADYKFERSDAYEDSDRY